MSSKIKYEKLKNSTWGNPIVSGKHFCSSCAYSDGRKKNPAEYKKPGRACRAFDENFWPYEALEE